MANYNSTTRTNYFKVKDRAAFYQFIQNIEAETTIEIFEYTEAPATNSVGETTATDFVGFGLYGGISGYGTVDEHGDFKVDEETTVEQELQKIIADDDAAIIFESGYEKLRYVTGYATVITADKIEYLSIDEMAIKMAQTMLNNPKWQTTTEY